MSRVPASPHFFAPLQRALVAMIAILCLLALVFPAPNPRTAPGNQPWTPDSLRKWLRNPRAPRRPCLPFQSTSIDGQDSSRS